MASIAIFSDESLCHYLEVPFEFSTIRNGTIITLLVSYMFCVIMQCIKWVWTTDRIACDVRTTNSPPQHHLSSYSQSSFTCNVQHTGGFYYYHCRFGKLACAPKTRVWKRVKTSDGHYRIVLSNHSIVRHIRIIR